MNQAAVIAAGTQTTMFSNRIIKKMFTRFSNARVTSICTGAMILAAAGLLNGKTATTKVEVVPPEDAPLDVLKKQYTGVKTRRALIVDQGPIVTGGGVTLCIDTILYVIEREFGANKADEVARIMEYQAARQANTARLATIVER